MNVSCPQCATVFRVDPAKVPGLSYRDDAVVQDGKIIDNWVMIDVIDVMRQLGVDPLNGKGWDDRGEGFRPPSQIERPDAA